MPDNLPQIDVCPNECQRYYPAHSHQRCGSCGDMVVTVDFHAQLMNKLVLIANLLVKD